VQLGGESMRYKKISEKEVFETLIQTNLDFMNPLDGAINLCNIAYLLKTSRYQVKKYIDSLKGKGITELKCINIYSDEEIYPPYWGYVLTEKGKQTTEYKKFQEKHLEIIKECFGN
jgi:hypothetical protein